MLDRSATEVRRYTFFDLVHPEDGNILRATAVRGGRAELRLIRRDRTCAWDSLRNNVITPGQFQIATPLSMTVAFPFTY
ncbi:hypothetical protein FB570_111299 [Streptomyces sp. T12]|nr:hypothetical protein FB570_111299 [Streptomyces sp. T12]